MLAYVFWHWKQDSVGRDRYEELAGAFHRSLARTPPPGFIRSAAFAVEGAPWIPGGRPAYEDWYAVEGSAALDPLDEAAISGSRREPHDAIASSVTSGAGGLYKLRRGSPQWGQARFASWFGKPPGMPYESLYALLEPIVSQGSAVLWGRQMVLGPAPEFCLQSGEPRDLPDRVPSLTLSLRTVWPEPLAYIRSDISARDRTGQVGNPAGPAP